jgi:dTDP-4-amino-4,6-dideoxygalactose transaminase
VSAVRQAAAPEAVRPLPFALPDITAAEIDAVTDVLRSGWLTTGPAVREFERAFAASLGVGHALAVNSGTAALHLALEAAGVGPGDEVIVPTYTFTASAEVACYLGARPVLVDVRTDDLNIDPEQVARALSPRTKAIVGVDIAGVPCDWHILRTVVGKGVALVDDAAHALPSALQGRPVGRWADITTFSFYATKTLTTGEGGMLVTDDGPRAEHARMMSLHGLSRDAWRRYMAAGSWFYEVVAAGYKYNMTDLAAALGLVQLRRLHEMHERRAQIARRYEEALGEVAELELPRVPADRSTSWHLYIIRLELERLSCDRAAFVEALAAAGIGVSVHFIPLHLHPFYRDTFNYAPDDFPVALREYSRVISLPVYSKMTDDDVDRVIAAVVRTVRANRR